MPAIEGEGEYDFMQIVYTINRICQLFTVAHALMTASYFSNRKTLGLLQCVFTWPSMTRDNAC